jgi:hypothetical protein
MLVSEASIAEHTARLTRGVRAVEDNRLWPPIVQGFVSETDPAELVAVVHRLITLGHLPDFRRTFHALIQCLLAGRIIEYQRSQDLYMAACDAELLPIQMLLLRAPALLSARTNDVLMDLTLRDIPLGTRKTMARSNDRTILTRLALDPAVSVVTILLDNPLLVEEDVVRIVARRPNLQDIIELVAKHPKWSLRLTIHEAIVSNPYTPTTLAAAFVPFLNRSQLLEVSCDGRIHTAVRDVARIVHQWRCEGMSIEQTPDGVVYELRPAELDGSPLDGASEAPANTNSEH